MRVLEAARQFRDSADPTELLGEIPFVGFAGIDAAVEGERLVSKMAFAPHLIGNPHLPALHGGTTAALLEIAAILELFWRGDTVRMPETIGLTVEYLRSARPLDTFATCSITKQGRRVAHVRVLAWQEAEERLIAAAQGRFLLRPSP